MTSAEAKVNLDTVLAEVERSGVPVTITSHGRAVAVIAPVQPRLRTFGQLPDLEIPEDFDASSLPEGELAAWEGAS